MKKNITVLILVFCLHTIAANAQLLVKGTVQDSSGLPLPGAIIRLKFQSDSIATNADVNGAFTFRNVKSSEFTLSASFISFKTFIKQYTFDKVTNEIILPPVKLKAGINNLNAVIITAVTPVKVKEDTLEFNAKSFAVREGASVDAVLKKLPGVTVDKNGNVTTQGKPITKVRVNGKDFFGTDVATAIQNLPADIVKNLQVIDDYGDQAKLTGIKTGEPEKILNINIQEDKKKGYFARGTGGMGNEERYIASMRSNFFNGERQVSVDGSMNNTNLRGGGGDGVTNVKNMGVNYRNKFGKTIAVDGGYSIRNRHNNTLGTSNSQSLGGFSRLENQISNNTSKGTSHNFWGNIEYSIDTLNYLKISPYGSFENSINRNIGTSDIIQGNLSNFNRYFANNTSAGANFGTSVFVNHKFLKRGRNISLFANMNWNKGDSYRDEDNNYLTDSLGKQDSLNQHILVDNDNRNFRTNANLSYMEPLGKQSFLELSYNWSRSQTGSFRDARDLKAGVEITNLNSSNNFEYKFSTNRISLNYRYIHQKFNYTLGIGGQQAILEGQNNLKKAADTYNKSLNIVPAARLVYRMSKQESLSFNYNGRNNQPGFNQLQPITDSTNRNNILIGNPDLKPEFTHGLNLEYNQSDWKKGHTFYANISYNQTQNKIVTTRSQTSGDTRQVTSYTNTDGFYNIRGNYSYSKPFSERKYTLTWDGGANMNNNLAFVSRDGVRARNIAKNFIVNQGIEFEIDLDEIIELEFKTSYSINNTRFSQANSPDRKTNTLEFQLEGENYFFKDLTLGYNISKRINRGFNNSAVQNPTIANLFMEYRFLKGNAGTIRVQGFDLLNQNTGLLIDSSFDYIVERQTNRLGRYFLMSFGLRLSKFGGGK
ncbi:MAG: outer membrane beta-barrel protein [Sphingobacteriaceae bacterium]|nr:outer membrane beta-barrel protein [Sphingobacteriaceae bacterium]